MELRDLREKLYKFDEGCELTDGVHALLSAARTLSGINDDTEADIAVLLARGLIVKYYQWVLDEGENYMFEEIDEVLFKELMGMDKNTYNFQGRFN